MLVKINLMTNYIWPKKIINNQMNRIAIFASGAGSNAQKIIEHFSNHATVEVALIVCNKPGAGVLKIAAAHAIETLIIDKEQFFRGDGYVPFLKEHKINRIILAGFLWKIPSALIQAYPQHIINIHPALLPKYGGKGMYGHHVHEAVIAANETESGITIHYVDEQYDHGDTIFQARCEVKKDDTPETLAQRIHALEHAHYPTVIEQLLLP
jgi:phosphoribosylglycinamide formyltransferase-1